MNTPLPNTFSLNKFANLSEEFFQMSQSELDFQKISDIFLEVVNAKFCIFNLYEPLDNSFTTVAISGMKSQISTAMNIIGINLVNKKWVRDVKREALIKEHIITSCEIGELIGNTFVQNIADQFIHLFSLGESYIIKIQKGNELLGDFLIIMDKKSTFVSHREAKIFTRFLGLLLSQRLIKLQLKQSEKRLSEVIEFLPDATLAIDNDGKIIIWNKAIVDMTGIQANDMLGKDNYEYAIPFYGKRRPQLIELINSTDIEIENIYSNFKRTAEFVSGHVFVPNIYNGKGAWVYAKASPLYDTNGNKIGAIEIIRDISELKATELALQQSKDNFYNLFQRAPLGYQSLDANGNFIEVNEAWLDTLGYTYQDVIGKWFGDFLADEYVSVFNDRFQLFKSQGKIKSEFYMKHKNGLLRYISFEGRVGYNNAGVFEKTHCILQDITDKKLAEEMLFESEQTHKALFEHSGVGTAYYTPEGIVISFNQKAAENVGMKRDELVGKNILDLFPIETASVYLNRITACAESEKPQNYEDYIQLIPGDKWFYSTFTRILDISGKVKGVQIISQDISEIKNIEQEVTYLNQHDKLTGLFNRGYFDTMLTVLNSNKNLPLTVVMGDVNGLKLINDSFGYEKGNQILLKISHSIKKACRNNDIIARLSGDEFGLILPNTNSSEANHIIQKIKSNLLIEKTDQIDVSISFGYETKYTEDENIYTLMNQAEDFMNRRKMNESSSIKNKTINLIMNTLFEKNKREMNHSQRVSEISVLIAHELGLDVDEINKIRTAGLLHDIGKIGIDEMILNSQNKLSADEWNEIKKHSEIGFRILSSSNEFLDVAEIIYSHHERWDGKGYPRNLSGESILIGARIIALADSFDAMISERPYRKSMNINDATNEIIQNAGIQFDPVLSKLFIENVINKLS